MPALPIIACSIVLSCAPGASERRPIQPGTAPADTLVDVGGYGLRFEIRRGDEPVAVLFENGGGADVNSWHTVPDSLARRTGATIVTYDRAGTGGSELGPLDLTPLEELRRLHGALDRLAVPAPTIVVGHSYGGMLALLHADLYPEKVRGLVLVDPMNPRFVEATGDFVQSTVPDIAEPANDRERLIVRMRNTFEALRARVAEIEPDLEIPIVVVSAGEAWWDREEIDRAWRESHEAIVAERPNRRLIVAEESDHDVPEERPDAVIDAVTELLEEVMR